MVEIRIFGALWEHLQPRMEVETGGRDLAIADLVAHLGIDPAQVGIVTIDGRQSRPDEIVPAGSRVCIFPPMFGG